jgi:hypothetical protein
MERITVDGLFLLHEAALGITDVSETGGAPDDSLAQADDRTKSSSGGTSGAGGAAHLARPSLRTIKAEGSPMRADFPAFSTASYGAADDGFAVPGERTWSTNSSTHNSRSFLKAIKDEINPVGPDFRAFVECLASKRIKGSPSKFADLHGPRMRELLKDFNTEQKLVLRVLASSLLPEDRGRRREMLAGFKVSHGQNK